MKTLKHQPKPITLAICVALGIAALGTGCSRGYNDTHNTSANPSAGVADSSQPATDTWITTKVKTALATMDGVDNTSLDVETNNGVVTLMGTASSQASIDAMAAAAMRVKGVTNVNTAGIRVAMVNNNANRGVNGDAYAQNDASMDAVTQDSHQPVQDTWITTKVIAKLHTIDGLDNTDLKVETSNGIVTLSGHADSQAMIDAAVAAARTIKGVKDVNTSMLKTVAKR